MNRISTLVTVTVAVLITCSVLIAADWPQWRGPSRDGVAPDSPALATTLPADGLPLLWKTGNIPSGDQGGFGSISVVGDRAYLYVNWKSKEPLTVRKLTAQGFQALGGSVEKLPEDLVKKIEDARQSVERAAFEPGDKQDRAKLDPAGQKAWDEREKLKPAALKTWIDGRLKEWFPDAKTPAAKTASPYVRKRLEQGPKALPMDVLDKLATMKDKEFADANALDRWLADNQIGKPVADQVLQQIPSTRDVAKDVFVCLSVADGKIVWKAEFPCRPSHWGSSSTPCVSGGRVYGAGDSVIYCLNAADGKLVWQAETKGSSISSSTMLLGDKVIVQAGVLTALNAADGKVAWTQTKVKGSNPSPVAWASGGRSFVIANGGALSCVDAADGNIAWTVPGSGSGTPVVHGDTVVLFGEGKAPGLVAYRMSPDKADLAWSVAVGDRGTTPIIHEGHVYAIGANKAMCVRLSDGRVMWEEKLRYCEITSPVLADGKVIATVEDGGTLMMFRASAGKFEGVGKLPRMRAASCSSPSVCGGKLFLRLKDGVGCFDLAAPGSR